MSSAVSSPAPKEDLSEWSKVVTPHDGWLGVRWREIWEYRDLISVFVRRDFVGTYKQTILGPLWFLLQPLFTTLVMSIIFGRVANISTDETPPFLFYFLGVVAWNYFADCLTKTATTFTANAGIFGKVYFPRLTVPIGVVVTNLITFAIQFSLFLVFLLFFYFKGAPVQPSFRVVVLPVLVFQMAALGLGVGCLVSSVTTRYRDLAMLVGFGTQLWMYASSVVFPLSIIPEKWKWLFVLNPMVPIIESFRFAFLGAGVIEIWQLAVSFVVSMLILLAGMTVFTRVERAVTDTI